jgi:hypothetical protein
MGAVNNWNSEAEDVVEALSKDDRVPDEVDDRVKSLLREGDPQTALQLILDYRE